MKRAYTPEELLMFKEGRGRFNLKKTLSVYPAGKPGRSTGPVTQMINLPLFQGDTSSVLPRVKLVPKMMKDAMGNDVRVFVPYKKKRR